MVRVEYHRGHFKNPLTDAELEEKFRLMAQSISRQDRVDAPLLRLALGHRKHVPQAAALTAATRV